MVLNVTLRNAMQRERDKKKEKKKETRRGKERDCLLFALYGTIFFQ
jgi:hypothetical protein